MQRFGWATLAAALVVSGTSTASAQETVLLGGTGDAAVQSLLFDGQADTEPVYYRGGYRGWSGYRGWGGYRAWGYGGWGHRGWGYAGFYRPYAYRPYIYRPYVYRPFYFGYGYRPYYAYAPYAYPYYSSSYYYAPSYYSAPAYDYPDYGYDVNPSSTDTPSMPNAVVLGSSYYTQAPSFQTPTKKPAVTSRPPLAPQSEDGTYYYDGGPTQPMPLPGQDSAPAIEKRPSVPLDGRLVSVPSPPAKYSYPAYGDSTPPSTPGQATMLRVASSPTATTRTSYPAYGGR